MNLNIIMASTPIKFTKAHRSINIIMFKSAANSYLNTCHIYPENTDNATDEIIHGSSLFKNPIKASGFLITSFEEINHSAIPAIINNIINADIIRKSRYLLSSTTYRLLSSSAGKSFSSILFMYCSDSFPMKSRVSSLMFEIVSFLV
ncbi:MAG: hypothetical protein BWY74_04518 [Firmicutes bacterium ADurb.Bin419]|nr:MAG: hypothetical protein BWY74_04518 [Firmicutes bacterium ADurb.Bin419]